MLSINTLKFNQFVFIAFFFILFTLFLYYYFQSSQQVECNMEWNGYPVTTPGKLGGSCWCSNVHYCICSPSLAIDGIIEYQESHNQDVHVILVFRRDPPKARYAIPGGFVQVGETVEEATIREVKEETNLTIVSLEQFAMYSDPSRDPRRHTASMVFRCQVQSIVELHSGDDAKEVKVIKLKDALSLTLAFDHLKILTDFTKKFYPELLSS
jgi:8-oxo-dGTP diphosphatase